MKTFRLNGFGGLAPESTIYRSHLLAPPTKLIVLVFLFGVLRGINAQDINLGSGNYLMLHMPGDVNWKFGKDADHNINIYGYGYDVRRFRILNSGNSEELFNVNLLTGNVGIGTPAPTARLHIAKGDLLLQSQSTGYPILWMKDVSGNNAVRFDYNSVIHAGGNFHIRSGGTSYLLLNDSGGGNVGIGTSNPGGKLEINQAGGQLKLTDGTEAAGLFTNSADLLHLADWNTATKGFTINLTSGNVGIGTTSPNEKLTVNGTIYGREVKVDLSVPGPDYVFEKDYNLPSLDEIRTHIDQHKHLPEVPSAKEMEENGINVGEMNMILLKKVEEMTLYLIKQNQEIQSLRSELEALKSEK